MAVILAGGKGMRANPYTHVVNKCLFSVHDHSLIEGQIAIARDQLGVREFLVLVGHLKEQVKAALGTGERLGVRLDYFEVTRIQDGPALGLLAARERISGPFFLMLGDEFHDGSRHSKLLDALALRPDALFTYTRTINPNQILANFSIEMDELADGGPAPVRGIMEKPRRIESDRCGCGTLYLTPRIFEAIEQGAPSARTGRVELYEAAASLAREGRVFAIDLEDPDYVNINTLDDLRRAVFAYRSRRFPQFKISVVIPAWNEADSIGHVVSDFRGRPQVEEILVMDNQSQDGTAEAARRAGARVISRPLAGYGDAIRQGLNEAIGDILVITEADYTFRAHDLPKLLEYLKDADMAVGTRTTRQLIAQGANMEVLARIGNVAMAKYLEALWFWLETRFTDVGCSYRAIWRREWEAIEPNTRTNGPEFSPEMMIEVIKARKNCIEVPVSYHPRFGGESKHSRGLAGLTKTALRMGRMITGRWAATVLNIAKNWISGER
jgi:NDP-sugar pyrophosphorylase family protein